ncbi:hypothetical protein PHISP_06302 [Aspergillus sp. HF37]|nr:hypothetical protein PHISP_06302 [Aspergillus sp. HF37]
MPAQTRAVSDAPRNKIAELYGKLEQLREVDEIPRRRLERLGIQLLHLDLNRMVHLDDGDEFLDWAPSPSILFHPLLLSALKKYPIRPELAEDDVDL